MQCAFLWPRHLSTIFTPPRILELALHCFSALKSRVYNIYTAESALPTLGVGLLGAPGVWVGGGNPNSLYP